MNLGKVGNGKARKRAITNSDNYPPNRRPYSLLPVMVEKELITRLCLSEGISRKGKEIKDEKFDAARVRPRDRQLSASILVGILCAADEQTY